MITTHHVQPSGAYTKIAQHGEDLAEAEACAAEVSRHGFPVVVIRDEGGIVAELARYENGDRLETTAEMEMVPVLFEDTEPC